MKVLIEEVRSARRLPPRTLARAIRKAAGVSQTRLAAELGVNRVTVARWESGTRRPSRRLLHPYTELLEALRSEVRPR